MIAGRTGSVGVVTLVGDREVIATGTVFTRTDTTVQITLTDGPETIIVEIFFREVEGQPKSNAELMAVSSLHARLALLNWGTRALSPMELGTLNGRPFDVAVATTDYGAIIELRYTFTAGRAG